MEKGRKMAVDPRFNMTIERDASNAEIDAGLRSHMLKVYNLMALGVGVTGLICFFVATNMALLQALMPISFVFLLASIGVGWFAPKVIMSKSMGAAQGMFWAYAALLALGIAPMVAMYLNTNPMIVARAFLISAGMFAGASLVGYTTKKNLSGMAQFMMMAMIGLFILMLVNIFLGSTLLSLGVSFAMVILLAGMTAYETQEIKSMYLSAPSEEVARRLGIMGALQLYSSFVIMFIHVLNILGIMNSDD